GLNFPFPFLPYEPSSGELSVPLSSPSKDSMVGPGSVAVAPHDGDPEAAAQSMPPPAKKERIASALLPKNKECEYKNEKWFSDNRRPLYLGLVVSSDFQRPKACEMPEFEASQFFRRMQDKTIAYLGDSLGRQMFQSIMCMVTAPVAKRPNGWAYRFPSTNTTILYHWSSTLCDLKPLNPSDRATSYAMHLDRPPAFLKSNLHRLLVLVLNTGHHWNRGKLRANRCEMYLGGAPNNDRNTGFIWKAKNFTVHSVVRWVD
ncbi:hypothetical protein ACJX0J_041656, partial [Zea mays]